MFNQSIKKHGDFAFMASKFEPFEITSVFIPGIFFRLFYSTEVNSVRCFLSALSKVMLQIGSERAISMRSLLFVPLAFGYVLRST